MKTPTTSPHNLRRTLNFLQFNPISTLRFNSNSQIKFFNKALRILHLVSPKPTPIDNLQTHLRLVQDFLQSHPKLQDDFAVSNCNNRNPSERIFESFVFEKEGSISVLFGMHRKGLKIDANLASYAVSACGVERSIRCGIQIHGLVVKNGVLSSVFVGSSLVNLYGKCGELGFACKMFDEMPERNVVSWTALINGFASELRVDVCMELYKQMSWLCVKANDFTVTTVLSACMGSGCLGQGRSVHCQVIRLHFDAYVHVVNALISMYCKCGNIRDAFCVFESMCNKDIVSWNSMIAGYALHGFAAQAIDLFELMREQKTDPDGITFLNLLSVCRHVGLVDRGRFYFDLMIEHGVKPDLDHYSCVVDLLARSGLLEEARDFILKMPMQPNGVIWGTLLSSCRLHGNVWIGIEAAERRIALEPGCAATHVQLANLYARVGLWDQVARVRKMMKDGDLKTNPGYSWIEVGNKVYRFRADDTSNTRMSEILMVLDSLNEHLEVSCYVCDMHEDLGGVNCFPPESSSGSFSTLRDEIYMAKQKT